MGRLSLFLWGVESGEVDWRSVSAVPLDMLTVPAGAPSIRSGWLELFKVMRREDPGGIDTFMPERINVAAEAEVLGRLMRMVFFPAEFEP